MLNESMVAKPGAVNCTFLDLLRMGVGVWETSFLLYQVFKIFDIS